MITFEQIGDFNNTKKYLTRLQQDQISILLDRYGAEGVRILSLVTPKETGVTASSWTYEIVKAKSGVSLYFSNSHVTKTGTPIAILIQYGHGTGTGGYVPPNDFLNPALRPLFDKMADEIWKEVTAL